MIRCKLFLSLNLKKKISEFRFEVLNKIQLTAFIKKVILQNKRTASVLTLTPFPRKLELYIKQAFKKYQDEVCVRWMH